MWTEKQREVYRQTGSEFPSDFTDAHWARLEPLIPRDTGPSSTTAWSKGRNERVLLQLQGESGKRSCLPARPRHYFVPSALHSGARYQT